MSYRMQCHPLYIVESIDVPQRAVEAMAWLKRHKVVPLLVPEEHVYFLGSEDSRVKVVLLNCLKLDKMYENNEEVLHALEHNVASEDKNKQKYWSTLQGQCGAGPWQRMDRYFPEGLWTNDENFQGPWKGERFHYFYGKFQHEQIVPAENLT